ncbi:MAG: hypothetical protein KGJ11_00390 [Candidatus Omnitrophica bacterium]|nr:hypothetical protein [Candidatus Omnitrophota bacterium]
MMVWLFLWGIYCFEMAGYFQDTQEHDAQTIEHLLASPVEKSFSTDHNYLKTVSYKANAPIFDYAFLKQSIFIKPVNLLVNESPPHSVPRLYQLFSVYRI